MLIAVLPWANRAVGAGDSLYSIARLAHGRPVLWLGTFGCAGRVRVARRFPDVLRLHVPHVRVAGEHAHFGGRGCPGPDRVMDRAQPVFLSCVWLLFICTVYICTHSRILALLANVYCLSYDFK